MVYLLVLHVLFMILIYIYISLLLTILSKTIMVFVITMDIYVKMQKDFEMI